MPKSVEGVMDEFKEGALHSGKKAGPVVKDRKQAIAIAMSEQGEEAGEKHRGGVPKKKAKKRKRMSAKEADQKAGSSLKKDLFETYRR